MLARANPLCLYAIQVGTLARMLKMTYFQHTSSAVQIVNRFLQGNSAVFDVGSVRPWGRGMSWPVEVDINYQLSIVQYVLDVHVSCLFTTHVHPYNTLFPQARA